MYAIESITTPVPISKWKGHVQGQKKNNLKKQMIRQRAENMSRQQSAYQV
jgi:hypothetical protein